MNEKEKKFRIGLGVSGGIAAYKAIEVLRLLQKAGCDVQVAMTRHATEFVQPLTFRALTEKYVLVDDYNENNPDPIAHINFSQNIDLLLIVPATANILAKFANGIADDFLTSTYLASNAPVMVAPAMNVSMWNHPATQRNIEKLKSDGVHFVEPVSGELACKTVGTGKLEDVENITKQALNLLNENNEEDGLLFTEQKDLSGEHILITVGATREEIDPVRFISNYSSGKMGFSIAEASVQRGAKVTVVAGSTSVESPKNIRLISVKSAEEMFQAVVKELKNKTVFVGTAAVADYRPIRSEIKIKKNKNKLNLELEKTTDILAYVSANRPPPSYDNEWIAELELIVIGFAAETNDLENYAKSKLESKNLDLIVANDVSDNSIGFGSENNSAIILRRYDQNPIKLPEMPKRKMADKILDEVVRLRNLRQGINV